MRRLLLFAIIVLHLSASAQQWKWAYALTRSASGPGPWLLKADVDAAGYPYFVGTGNSSLVFNAQNGTFPLNGYSAFVTKYDAAGNLLWLGGGKGSANMRGFATDPSGNTYVSGDFNGSLSFGPGADTLQQNSVNGSADGYLVKLDKDGKALSFLTQGGSCSDVWSSAAALKDGGVVVAGFEGEVCAQHYASFDGILRKYNAIGVEQWSLDLPGKLDHVYHTRMAATVDSGFVIVAVYEIGGPNTVQGMNGIFNTEPCRGGTDIVVVRYAADGSIQWTRTINGKGNEFVSAISSDPYGNTFFALITDDTTYYDGIKLDPNDHRTTHLIKVDPSGNFLQALSFRSYDPYFYPHTLANDAKGNLYMSARAGGDLAIGSDSVHFNGSQSQYAHAVIKLDNALHYTWSQYATAYRYSNTWASIAVSDSAVYWGMYYDVAVQLNESDMQFSIAAGTGGNCFFAAITNTDHTAAMQEPARNSVGIYPNPCHKDLFINNTPGVLFKGIYNCLGEKTDLEPVNGRLDMSRTPAGIYLADMVQGEKHIYFKIIHE